MSGPHDLFVRFTFGHPERAAAELRAALPPHLVSQVDWASLRREPSSVVDPELRETESDLLFSARLAGGRPLLFHVLLEHPSSGDRWMAQRMLRLLAARGEHVDKKSRHCILSCTDMETLDRWFDQALRATRLSDVLGDLAQ